MVRRERRTVVGGGTAPGGTGTRYDGTDAGEGGGRWVNVGLRQLAEGLVGSISEPRCNHSNLRGREEALEAYRGYEDVPWRQVWVWHYSRRRP